MTNKKKQRKPLPTEDDANRSPVVKEYFRKEGFLSIAVSGTPTVSKFPQGGSK